MKSGWPALRTAVHEAISLLKRDKYQVLRVAGTDRLYDLVAYRPGDLLFVVVRTSRTGEITKFPEELREIVADIRAGFSRSVQFWVRQMHGWNQYEVTHGGALRLPGGSA